MWWALGALLGLLLASRASKPGAPPRSMSAEETARFASWMLGYNAPLEAPLAMRGDDSVAITFTRGAPALGQPGVLSGASQIAQAWASGRCALLTPDVATAASEAALPAKFQVLAVLHARVQDAQRLRPDLMQLQTPGM